jgi:hypothetical protein
MMDPAPRPILIGDVPVERYPHVAAGHRSGAADELVLLDDEDTGATVCGQQRGGERTAAAADDNDVENLVPAGVVSCGHDAPQGVGGVWTAA